MKHQHAKFTRSFLVGAAFVLCSAASHAQLGVNLISNGDAESGPASAGGFDVIRPIPGWTPTGNFTVVQYNAPGGFPLLTDPGPSFRGNNFFAGGTSNGSSSASQTIDVSAESSVIDLGNVAYDLSGWLGGYDGQDDNAVLTATFLSGSDAVLGSTSIGPVTEPDRNGQTALLFRNTSGTVPVGTQQIDLVLRMTRLEGDYNDGYADNLSLVLNGKISTVPEPGACALLGSLGLTAAGLIIRKRSC